MIEKRGKNKRKPKAAPTVAALMLDWYDAHRRTLPWRPCAGAKADPYHVWLSEVMLQQTTVATVGPYYQRFLQKWPRLVDLAQASLDDVYRMWAGLGYYRRARGLHACALQVMQQYGGVFPDHEVELLKLAGIGPYTAAAISAIAFNQKANVVDGNVERVMARLHAVSEPMPKGKKKIKELALVHLPNARFGDYAQSLMDLGATICTPRSPKCPDCPIQSLCSAFQKGQAEAYPRRMSAKPKPVRYGTAFVLFDRRGAVCLRQRPDEGLLAGMMEVPSTPWMEGKKLAWGEAQRYAPLQAEWTLLSGAIHHVFTHFNLEMEIAIVKLPLRVKEIGRWVEAKVLDNEALPSVMRKILARAYKEVKG